MPRGRPTVRALRDGGSLPPAPPEALVINPGIRANRVNLSRRQAMSHMTAIAILTFTLGIAASATARAAHLSDDEQAQQEQLTQPGQIADEHQHDRPTATPDSTTAPAQPVNAEEVAFGELA